MMQCLAYAFKAIVKSRTRLVVENLRLRQQLVVLKRCQLRARLRDEDRRFWVFSCRWFSGWRQSLIIVRPHTVVGRHRRARKAPGAGDHAAQRESDAGRLNPNSGNSFAVWLGRIPLGDNAGSGHNWNGLLSNTDAVFAPYTWLFFASI